MTFVAIALIACGAFATEGALGFGATVIAASLAAQLVPLAQLLPALVPVNLALSTYLVARGARAIAWRLLLVEIVPPTAAGALVGVALFAPGRGLLVAFGLFVVALAALELVRPAPRLLAPWPRRVLLVAAGVAHGLFGTGGPLVVYVAGRRLRDPGAMRSTLAVLWLALNVLLVASYARAGLYTRDTAVLLGVLAAALAPGLWLGERLHARLRPAHVWLVLLAAGTLLAARAITSP